MCVSYIYNIYIYILKLFDFWLTYNTVSHKFWSFQKFTRNYFKKYFLIKFIFYNLYLSHPLNLNKLLTLSHALCVCDETFFFFVPYHNFPLKKKYWISLFFRYELVGVLFCRHFK